MVQSGIESSPSEEIVVGALGDELAILKDEDLVSGTNGTKSMSDDNYGPVPADFMHRILDQSL